MIEFTSTIHKPHREAEWKIRNESNLCEAIVGGRDWLRRWNQYIDFNRHDETFAPPINQSGSHWVSVFMLSSKFFVYRLWFYSSWMRAIARGIPPFRPSRVVFFCWDITIRNLIWLLQECRSMAEKNFLLFFLKGRQQNRKKKKTSSFESKAKQKESHWFGSKFTPTHEKKNTQTAMTLILCA